MAKKAPAVSVKVGAYEGKEMLLSVSQLNPAPYNPRKIDPGKFEALKTLVRRFGLIQQIVVQKKGFTIIGGHQRLRALKEVCVEDEKQIPKVKCVVMDIDDREAKKLNLGLNKVQGDWEARLLGEAFVDLRDNDSFTMQEMNEIGFVDDEVDRYVRFVEPTTKPTSDDLSEFGKSVTLSLEFTDTKMRDAVKALLKERSDTAKKKSGELVADALGVRAA